MDYKEKFEKLWGEMDNEQKHTVVRNAIESEPDYFSNWEKKFKAEGIELPEAAKEMFSIYHEISDKLIN